METHLHYPAHFVETQNLIEPPLEWKLDTEIGSLISSITESNRTTAGMETNCRHAGRANGFRI